MLYPRGPDRSWNLTRVYDPDALCDVCHKKDRVKRHYVTKWTLCESCHQNGWRPPQGIKFCGRKKFLVYTTATCSLTVPFPE